MTKEWLITPNDGLPAYYLQVPEGETPIIPDGYACQSAPPKASEADAEAAREVQFRGDGSWNTPWGVMVKNQRNAKLADVASWMATDKEASPLSEDSRLEWVAYVQALQRITVDFPGPGKVTWPTEPEKRYPPAPKKGNKP